MIGGTIHGEPINNVIFKKCKLKTPLKEQVIEMHALAPPIKHRTERQSAAQRDKQKDERTEES